MARDREQPRARIAEGGLESGHGRQRSRERLSSQIERHLRLEDTPAEEREDRSDVPIVELPESLPVLQRRR